MAKNRNFDWNAFNGWLSCQSMAVQALVEKYPPDRLYYLKNEVCEAFVTITGYQSDLVHEDTVTVHVSRQFNLALKHTLPADGLDYYGTPLYVITECDLPHAFPNEGDHWAN